MDEYNDSKLSIYLLGSPQVYRSGVPVQVRRKRVRALLFYLAAEQKPVPRSRLAYMLWPDNDSASASKNLSIHISYLKNDLGEDCVQTSMDHVALNPSIASDIREFNELVSNEEVDSLCRALSLFRGGFLDGFTLQHAQPFEQWSLEMSSYWNDRFIQTSLRVSELLAEDGDYDRALNILSEAQRLDPLQEAICRMRMRILSLGGKRSAVSRVYYELVSLLNSELGVPPAPETADCYQQIIASDAEPLPSVPSAAPGKFYGHEDMVFVGRKEQLEALGHIKSGSFILIQGKSGLGKTRLIKEYSSSSGLHTITIAFKEREQDIPYSGFIKYIRSIVSGADGCAASEQIKQGLHPDRYQILCQLIPELGHGQSPRSSAFVTTSRQILEALEQLFLLLLGDSQSIFSIDDIHNADSDSLELMLYLMSQPTMKNVKFIATFRPSLSGPKIISFFDSVQRENAMYTLNIGKLDNKSMLSLLLHYFPDINTDTALGLVELADGNPYWMKTIMSGLDSGYNDFSGKASLIGLFNMSLSALSVQARGIVNALAILGESCAEKLFACICSESRAEEPDEIYSQLFTANLISRDFDGSIKFSHAKIYEHVLSLLSDDSRLVRALHLLIAKAMEKVYGEETNGQRLISIAEHYKLSSEPDSCGEYAFKAGTYLLSVGSNDQAIKYYKLAFSHLPLPSRLDALLPLYTNMIQLGYNYEAKIYLQNAIQLAGASGLQEYSLFFTALLRLSDLPEFIEVRHGVFPCYSIPADESVCSLLNEARELLRPGDNPYLLYNLLHVLSAYYTIIGEYESSKNCLWEIISANIINIDEKDVLTAVLTYSSVRDLIVMLNRLTGSETMEAIYLKEQAFKDVPMQSLQFINTGTIALRKYIQGNVEDGIQTMNRAISEARSSGSKANLADSLVTQATLLRHLNPEKSYSMNYEAYTISKANNCRFSLVRALTGLVVTCSSAEDAAAYCAELEALAEKIGDPSVIQKLDTAKRALQFKAGR